MSDIIQKVPFRKIFGLNFVNLTMNESCELLAECSKSKNRFYSIFTPNAQMTVDAIANESFMGVLKKADFLLPDGISIVIASKILNIPLKCKVSGSTFFQKGCGYLSTIGAKIFLLGAADGVAEKAYLNLKKKYPNLNNVQYYSPPLGFENDKNENFKIIEMLKESTADVLFVAMSNGRGEKWIIENKDKYQIPVSIQVGAAFDFAAGLKSIPPEIIKKIGLAWLWRLIHEPKRLWRRYFFEDSKILFYIIKEKINQIKEKN
jgi:N-acetylglucosaminyldiphosphoundecaprenol N-acetyl-beta-D-mannosaminyltransferase